MDSLIYEVTFSMDRIGKFDTLKEACECVIKKMAVESKRGFPAMLFETIWIKSLTPENESGVNRFAQSVWFWDKILELCHEQGWMNNKGWIDEDQVVQSTFDF